MSVQDDKEVIAVYSSGSADADALENELPKAWLRVLSDENKRFRIAGLLNTERGALNADAGPPFRIRPARAGMDLGTATITVLIWFGSDVLLGALTGMARDQVKQRLTQIWKLVEPELRGLFDRRDALGQPKVPPDE